MKFGDKKPSIDSFSTIEFAKSAQDNQVFPFKKWDNIYLSNKKLGDEYRYVFNRRNAKRFIGNTLERPQLVLKRLKVRETNFDSEVVREGAQYESLQAEKEYAKGMRVG
jgi:hypothetical protein